MMGRTSYHNLIDLGRKAGLGTSELYRALAARRPDVHDPGERADGNGFVSGYAHNGQRVYRPIGGPTRP